MGNEILIEKTVKLIGELYDIKKMLVNIELEKIKIIDDKFLIKDTGISKIEFWNFYNLDVFIERKIPRELLKLDYKKETKEDINKLSYDEWIRKYGKKLYAKEKLLKVRCEILALNEEWKSLKKESCFFEIEKNRFDINKFLNEQIGKDDRKIDEKNLVISRIDGILMNQGSEKEKIIKELSWVRENIEKSKIEIIIPLESSTRVSRFTRCLKLKFTGDFIKFNSVNYFKNNKNIEVINDISSELEEFLLKYKIKNIF
ncbi:MAG: hypothetical protein ACRCWG_04580 [Sarcina sp.]